MVNRIQYYRNYYDMSQRQLALKAEISSTEMNYIEAGKRMSGVDKAIRIARALNTTVEKLWIEEDKK